MATWIDYLVFDILGDLCFGESFRTKEPEENKLKRIPHLPMNQVTVGYRISKSPLLGLMLYLQPRGLNNIIEATLRQEIKEYNSFVEDRVYKRIADFEAGATTSSRPDMLHFLLAAKDPDTILPAFSNREHLLADTKVLTLAGTDTTAESLSVLFFYLGHSPRVLAKLTEEVRSTFTFLEQISLGPMLSRCAYLRACIDEAMRLNHPAPGELPREVLHGGAIIDGLPCPAGIVVGCAGWSMGRDESVYGDANVYRPERWIPSAEGPSEADVRRLKGGFHPFSIGPMNCAGQNLAVLEMQLVTARTLWSTDLRLAPGCTAGEGHSDVGWG